MKFTELKLKSEAEIKQLLLELREKGHDLSVKIKLNQLKNTNELKAVKKDIARIMTFLNRSEADAKTATRKAASSRLPSPN